MNKLFALLMLLCVATHTLAQEKSLVHKDVKRKYIVYTPAGYEARPQQHYPVVVNYHGGGMTMREQMLYTQMNRTADRENFIVVYPQGIKQDWNVGYGMDYKEGNDDIGFTVAMLAKVKQDYRIDPQRVYATGLSRGGFFSLRLAAELPQLFAAVAAVGALMPQPVIKHHANPARVGVMLMHGTADQLVAFDGKPDAYLSASESYQYWLKNNGLDGAPATQRVFNRDRYDGTDASLLEQGAGAVHVALVTIKDGGHTWAGADAFNVGLPIGLTSRDIDANALIWAFLSKHRK
ncbi:MAG: PHB depolymerase family esterase [Telluria sp.]